jgi:hypothetical protein
MFHNSKSSRGTGYIACAALGPMFTLYANQHVRPRSGEWRCRTAVSKLNTRQLKRHLCACSRVCISHVWYVCMYVCMHACMCVQVYVHAFLDVLLMLLLLFFTSTWSHCRFSTLCPSRVCFTVCVCMCVCVCVCVRVYVRAWTVNTVTKTRVHAKMSRLIMCVWQQPRCSLCYSRIDSLSDFLLCV